MKATSIEQIREHLARGGRVMCHFVRTECGEPEVNDVYGAASGDRIVVNYVDQMRVKFGDNRVDHWELLPIEEKPLPGIDSRTLPILTEDPTGGRFCDAQTERMQRIRQSLLFGYYPAMNDLLAWWQAMTGERIEWGRRCNACECSGDVEVFLNHITDSTMMFSLTRKEKCKRCNGSGYTVRPTWMGPAAG